MLRVLIVFGTTDGHTARVATALAEECRRLGADVELVDAAAIRGSGPSPDSFDRVIVAASIHIGGFQRPVRRWVRGHATSLRDRQTLFVSVCLAVLQRDLSVRQDLDRIVTRFREQTGWTPGEVVFVPGMLAYTRYGWLRRLVMRRIAGRAGGSTDTTRDHDYTDWTALRDLAGRFLASPRVHWTRKAET